MVKGAREPCIQVMNFIWPANLRGPLLSYYLVKSVFCLRKQVVFTLCLLTTDQSLCTSVQILCRHINTVPSFEAVGHCTVTYLVWTFLQVRFH